MSKERLGWAVLAIVVLLSSVLAVCTKEAPASETRKSPAVTEKTVWRVQSCYPGSYDKAFRFWADCVEKSTGGRLTFDIAPPNGIVGTRDVFNAVRKGIMPLAGIYYAAWYQADMPEATVLQAFPFAWNGPEEIWYWLWEMGAYDIIKPEYEKFNLYWLPYICEPEYTLLTTYPIKGYMDMKGKKIRAIGPFGEWAQFLGAAPVSLPSGETYMALKLGTIDGALQTMSTFIDVKYAEPGKYVIKEPAISRAHFGDILINLDALHALPQDIQDILKLSWQFLLAPAFEETMVYVRQGYETLKKDYDITLITCSSEEVKELKAITEAYYDQVAKKSAGTAKLIELLKKQHRLLGRSA